MKILWEGLIPEQLHLSSSSYKKNKHRLVLRSESNSILGEVQDKKGNWVCCFKGIEQYMCEQYIKEVNGLEKPKLKGISK